MKVPFYGLGIVMNKALNGTLKGQIFSLASIGQDVLKIALLAQV